MRKFILVITVVLLSSCINQDHLHPVFPIHILHGNSAKVWILNHSTPEDKNTLIEDYKTCYIFYSNKTFMEQELIYLGSSQGRSGSFSISYDSIDTPILRLVYDNAINSEETFYKIERIENKILILTTENNDEFHFNTLAPPR